jgi:outer membrane lipoprotein SlyB
MFRSIGAGAILALAAMLPVVKAAAQDRAAGVVVGGALGGLVGGALGRGSGTIVNAAVGAATGAMIAAKGKRRAGGFYWWQGGCYYRYPNDVWLQVKWNYCDY